MEVNEIIMGKGLILLADGFEDVEGIGTYDVLKRAKIDIDLVSISNNYKVVTSHGINVLTRYLINDVKLEEYDFLILPGGLKGVNNLSSSNDVINAINYFMRSKKDVYAICAAPSILGKLGYLDDVPFTCYPGFESYMRGKYTGNGVTISSTQIITAKSMAYSIDFGLAIIEKKLGKETSEKVRQSCFGIQ